MVQNVIKSLNLGLPQVASGSQMKTRADLANSEVITLVKKLAKEHHSAALAQLASRIAVVARYGSRDGADPFAKVKGLISDMITKLEKEAEAEATEKAYCEGVGGTAPGGRMKRRGVGGATSRP